MNPEFLTEISGSWSKDEETKKDFFTEDRIIIGEEAVQQLPNNQQIIFSTQI